jgi:mRNA interferase YafQ
MKQIELTNQFKRDAKKHFLDFLTPEWAEVLNCLLNGLTLPEKYRDHPLKGNLKGFRDCHIKPDLVLLYTISDDCIHLIRIGSHSELDIA